MARIVGLPDRGELTKEAAEWLIRLDADAPPTREELQALGEWLRRSPAHCAELKSLAALWGRMNVLTELAVPLGNSRQRPWRRVGVLVPSIAAVLAVVVIVIARHSTVDEFPATNGLYATAVGQQQTTTLADGSQVMLNTNSQIKVDYGDKYRRVYLLGGEVLFTVAKHAARPFRVYAGNGRIEAIGTAFSVHLKGSDVDVTVAEGRVALASMNLAATGITAQSVSGSAQPKLPDFDSEVDESSVRSLGVISAGQVATIRNLAAATAAGSANVVEEVAPIAPQQLAQRLAWREGVVMFSGETLENVVKELSRYTTVSIEIPDAAIRNMRVGGRFPVRETETMLSALETNFNLRVIRLSHDRVVLALAGD